uniref:Uncharacterized protein n=1 Tax=viral metagenome TaxID=1070528 RepID=A0A6C0J3C6_9ZZZZ
MAVAGGVTINNGYRPLYQKVVGTSQTLAAFGIHYDITNSGFNALTIPSGINSNDSNAYWILRNNTSSYLSVAITNSAGGTAPSSVTIPPANSVTLMFTYVSSTSNYVLF